jgi:predicted GNAT family acetyltransferase
MGEMAEVIDDHEDSRFEIVIDGSAAELVYRRRADRLVLVHTEVPSALAGHGIGGQLVEAAARRAARERLTLVPLCPFARDWLERHPDLAATVNIDWGAPPDD